MRRTSTIFLLGCGSLVALATCSEAVAQLSADPYNPWNSQYESYVYPSVPGGIGVYPGQASFEVPSGNRGANRFNAEVLEPFDRPSRDEGEARVPLRRGVGVPYTRAFRNYDQMYGRVYTPNAVIDDEYNRKRELREQAYSAMRDAKTPQERAERRRDFNLYNRKLVREQLFGSNRSPAAIERSRASRSARGSSSSVPPRPRTLPSPSTGLSDDADDDATPRRPRSSGSLTDRPGSGRLRSPARSTRPTPSSPEAVLERSRSMNRGRASDSSDPATVPPRRRP